jgi:ferredoxin
MGDKKIAKITVDRGLCIGAASCLSAIQGVYELDEENKAVLLMKGDQKSSGPAAKGDLVNDSASDEELLASAQACPTMAILLHGEDGEQIYP